MCSGDVLQKTGVGENSADNRPCEARAVGAQCESGAILARSPLPTLPSPPSSMQWHDWNDDAFQEARERGSLVLLFVKASWCRWCKELEERVLSDERVTERLAANFVAIGVDLDRRPDIDSRYTRRGWPTLAWLDSQGELLGADNFLDVEPLLERLEDVVEWHRAGPHLVRQRLSELNQPADPPSPPKPAVSTALGTPKVELSLDIVESVAQSVLESADPIHGGWGKAHKFPHPEAIDFALVRWSQTGDPQMLSLVRRTLRKMQEGEIHDSVEGGFYRYATQADWGVPNHEKMLDSNAQRAFAYLEAFQALGDESFEATARGALEWMTSTLFDPETHAFRGSQDADSEYARLSTREKRAQRGAPSCDSTIFANWNAMTVSVLLKADAVLCERRWRDHAVDTLEFLTTELWDSSKGVYHYWDGDRHISGMLRDQAYTLRALIDAVQFGAQNQYLETACQLADLSIRQLRADNGGFYDKTHDPHARGGLRKRNRSILENSIMAEALLRLSHLTGDRGYENCAREALASFAHDYKRYGHCVAGYARAVDLFFHVPVVVTIVGEHNSPAVAALQQAALKPYIASRVVRLFDPERDAQLLARVGLEGSPGAAHAYVERGRESYAETDDPRRLAALMMRT